MRMTPERWDFICRYLGDVFGRPDGHLAGLMDRAVAAGLPPIAITADVGRLLKLLVSMTNGGRGARLAVEIGTLAGFSGIWIARGLCPGGRLVTVEIEPAHADFAQSEFERAGVADRVDLRRTSGLEAIDQLVREKAEIDFVFLDAVKTEYEAYFKKIAPLIVPGGLLAADNMLGSGSWWIDDAPGSDPSRDAADRFNRLLASDDRFEAACVPIREGVLIARRKST